MYIYIYICTYEPFSSVFYSYVQLTKDLPPSDFGLPSVPGGTLRCDRLQRLSLQARGAEGSRGRGRGQVKAQLGKDWTSLNLTLR